MVFVFTGKGYYKGERITRDILHMILTDNGHSEQKVVDWNTHYLVAEFPKETLSTKKHRDAGRYGTKVISYDDFFDLLKLN